MSLIGILVLFVNYLLQLLSWVVIISALLSFFLDPYHPVRRTLDSVVEPMLAPIRRILPPIGGFDFSPVVLLVIIQVLANLFTSLLNTLR